MRIIINNPRTLIKNKVLHLTEQQLLILLHGGMAAFGALAKTLDSTQSGKAHSWRDKVITFTISSFAGAIFGMLAFTYFHNQPYLSGALSGAGAWWGQEGLNWMLRKFKNKADLLN